MKKPLFLLLASILVALGGHAQTNGLLSFSLGPALPVGEYASKNADAASSGLAKLGALADISYQHLFSKSHFGWIASLRYRYNGVDKNAAITPFEEEFPGYGWSMKNCHYTTASALIGGYYQYPLTSKLSLSASIELGVAESWSPKESITGVYDSVGYGALNLIEANLKSVAATSFTGLAGAGIRYQWNSRWAAVARIDYTWLKPTFHNVTASLIQAQHLLIPGSLSLNAAEEILYNASTTNYTQPMNTLDLTIGICRKL